MSSLDNNGILSSLTSPWSLAISRAHKKKFHTAPYSAIGDIKIENNKMEKNFEDEK